MIKIQNPSEKIKNATTAIVILVGALGLGNQVVAATVTPHRAFYEMQLGVADQNSNVQSVSGRSAFTLDRDCDGWRSNEEYLIEFGGQEGSRDRILSRFESWESDKGDMYSFEISENSSFEAAKDFFRPERKKFFQTKWYSQERKRLNILIDKDDKLTAEQKVEALELLKIDLENTKNARELQKIALQQDDLFSKRFIYYLAIFWSVICSIYFFLATFTEVVNEEMADIILGFLLGTVSGTVINFFFGSSSGSKEKDKR